MAYNPGVQDVSGQLLARGISEGAQGIASGLSQYYERQRMKKEEEKAVATFQNIARQNPQMASGIGLTDINDTGAIKAAVKGLGGAGNALKFASALGEYQTQAKQAEADKRAINALFSTYQQSGDLKSGLAAYAQAGGSPQGLNQIDTALNRVAAPPPAPQKVTDPVSVRGVDEKGMPVEITVDRLTGKEIGRGPVSQPKFVLSADEQIRVEGGKKIAEEDAKRASAFVTDVSDAAEAAIQIIPQLDQIDALYAEGAKSGFGQPFLTSAQQLAARMGLGNPEELKSQELLEKAFAQQALQFGKQVMQGGGAVSNFEREMVNKASADVGKSPAANRRIISIVRAVNQRNVDMEMERQRLVDDGKTTSSVAESLRRFRTKNPLSKYMEAKPEKAEEKQPDSQFSAMSDDALEKRRQELLKAKK